jgi:hypothetical protein
MTAGAAPVDLAASGLRLYVRCHDRLLAIEASSIERVLLVDEAPDVSPPVTFGVSFRAPLAALGVLALAGTAWAAWDLGLLLGEQPAERAWILSRVGPLPLALRTDRCLHVSAAAPSRRMALPAGIFRARPGLVRAAFAASSLRIAGLEQAPIGLDVDVARLLTPEERVFSQEVLERAREAEDGGARAL